MKHRYQIRIPSFLCRPDDSVGFDGMASVFQEAAWEHAHKLGVDFTDDGATVYWVLHRIGIRFFRRPRWGETITITTWPSRIVRLYAMREFVVHSESGELLADASSAWLVLDGERGRPVRPEQRLSREWAVDEVPLSIPTGKLPVIVNSRERLLATDSEQPEWHAVRRSDTDRNGHVNNARYLQWFGDAEPAFVGDAPCGVFEFTAETRAGQRFTVISNDEVAEVWVRDDGAPVEDATCACRFRPMEESIE